MRTDVRRLRPPTRLDLVAPRLGLAYRERTVELVRERAARRRARREVLEVERIVAHRDLQLVRAQATGNPAYIEMRERKLAQGQRRLAAARARAAEVGA